MNSFTHAATVVGGFEANPATGVDFARPCGALDEHLFGGKREGRRAEKLEF